MDQIKVVLGKSQSNINCYKRKGPYSVNLVHHLIDRETGFGRYKNFLHTWNQSWHKKQELPLFKCLPPNFTIQNIDKPYGYIRKFTPDGQHLVVFSTDQRAVDIYKYRGIGALSDLMKLHTNECVKAVDPLPKCLELRQNAFKRFFTRRFSVQTTQGLPGGNLNREFSLFLDNGRFLLVASMGISQIQPPIDHVTKFPDLCTECDLFFYNFYLIDLKGGRISDLHYYKYDSIQLSLNHGVSAFNKTVAIFSKYRQCIDVFEVFAGGLHRSFIVGVNGSHLREPDPLLDFIPPIESMPITHVKQRILSFLYRNCNAIVEKKMRRKKLMAFYRDFPKFETMIISKMQLLKKYILLIRYEQSPLHNEGGMGNRRGSGSGGDIYPFKLYVIYCMKTEEVLNVFPQNSYRLLRALRDYLDVFRNMRSHQTGCPPSSTSNNVYHLNTFNETVSIFEDGAERFNPTLPISSQSYSTSPYLDANQFIYDDRLISVLERPRMSGVDRIVFRDRETNKVLFRFHLDLDPRPGYTPDNILDDLRNFSVPIRRELVTYIFHPYEPFVISIQKLLQRYVINFHLYNKNTIVSP